METERVQRSWVVAWQESRRILWGFPDGGGGSEDTGMVPASKAPSGESALSCLSGAVE